MTTFLLIRHGSTELVGKALAGRLPAVSLDANGHNQAQELARKLGDMKITAVYSSPLLRAVETAEPLAARVGTQLQIREALTEIDFGSWQGKTLAQLEGNEHWNRFNTLRSATCAPDGEMMLEVQARVARELTALSEIHPDQTIAVFSHADVIKAILMLYMGIPLDFHLRLEISPASVSVLELGNWGARVVAMNR